MEDEVLLRLESLLHGFSFARRWDGRSDGTAHDGSGGVSSLIERGKEDFLSFFLSFDLGHEGFFFCFYGS
jgi:hypothetical protein